VVVDGNAPRTLTSYLSGTVLQTADRGNNQNTLSATSQSVPAQSVY